jgi:PAS domain S-box-containing protein
MSGSLRFASTIFGLVIGFIVADAVIDAFIFGDGDFVREALQPSPHTVFVRIFSAIVILVAGLVWRRANRRRDASDAALQASEKLYRDVVNSCPDAIVVHRGNRILYMNSAATAYLGPMKVNPLQDLAVHEFIHPDDRERSLQRRVRVLDEDQQTKPADIRLVLPDGTLRHALVTSARIVFAGEPAVLTFCRDVTEERVTRQDLAASRERLRLALEAAQDGVWDWDMVNDQRVYNKAWTRMLGLGPLPDAQSGEIWSDRVHPDDQARVTAAVAAHIADETPIYEAEVRLRHHDGHYLWVLDRGKVVERAADGTPLRMAGTHRNITERKEAQIALEIRNRIAETFLTSTREEVFVNVLPLIGEALQSPVAVLGVFATNNRVQIAAHDQSNDRDPRGASQNLTLSDLPGIFRDLLARREPMIRNSLLQLAALQRPLAGVVAIPILSKGRALGFLLAGDRGAPYGDEDVETLRSLIGYLAPMLEFHLESEINEGQLRQAQKMEAIGALAGGIAHDFNNILQAILGFSTLALEEAQELGSQQGGFIANDLERVVRATQRGKELVNRILLFSRQQEQEQRPVALGDVVSDTVGLLANTIPSTIKVSVDLAPECRLVLADPAQISQVIMNLATNSFHAMADGGRLTFSLRPLPAHTPDPLVPATLAGQDLVVLTVEDTGSGMDQNILDRLFDPFFTTKEVDKGTGLGLSVVHGIVAAHGGEIVIESVLGSGTSAHVFLPALAGDAIATSDHAAIPPGLGPIHAATPGSRILFVDDEPDIAALGQALLERQGHTVVTLTDSRIAVAHLRQAADEFDLVITDLTMPHLTGMQLADQLVQIRPELPVVLITGQNESPLEEYMAHPQIQGVLRKPFGGDTLRKTVAQVLREPPPVPRAAEQGSQP